MPRAMVTDPDKVAAGILFGDELRPVNLAEMGRRTGIAKSTLAAYKKEPSKIPLDRLSVIIRVRGLDDDQVAKLLRVYRKG